MFAALAVAVALGLIWAASAGASFGFKEVEFALIGADGLPATQAGSHPYEWKTALTLNTKGGGEDEIPDENLRDLHVEFPPGLVGVPARLPRCHPADYLAKSCPADTRIGSVSLTTDLISTAGREFPLFNLEPSPGFVAELGFIADLLPVSIGLSINPEPSHNVRASISEISEGGLFYGTVLSIRGSAGGIPFVTLPRNCDRPLVAEFSADSWESSGVWAGPLPVPAGGGAGAAELMGCDKLGFAPSISLRPTATSPGAPSGLDLAVGFNDPGLSSVTGIAEADLRRAELMLPEGTTVNLAVAGGLQACAPEDLARETAVSAPGVGCPEAARIGTAAVDSPFIDRPLDGSVYVAEPDNPATEATGSENPFDSLLALYVVLKDPRSGVLITQPIRLDPNPASGRVAAVIDGIPQLPFSELRLHLREGPRSPFVLPDECGTHVARALLFPSSGRAPAEESAAFSVAEECDQPRFAPTLSAGSVDPVAGASSPFQIEVDLGDRSRNPADLAVTLPRGLTADFAAVPLCPEVAVLANACPSASKVGEVRARIGAGEMPIWLTSGGRGGVFLAGPFAGAPFSLAIALPAKAGPFDLGTVALRAPIFVDRRTAQAEVKLTGLPQIRDGIPIPYRSLRILLQPGFVHNPTSCTASAVTGIVGSVGGDLAEVRDRFQVGDCAKLPFKPKLSMRILGPTRRGAHPRLRIVLKPRSGDANLRRVSATLPGTELLDTRRIRDVCSRVDFAAGRCSSASVYGRVKAWTPLLDRPLEGPVYLRESKGRLPELAVTLEGQIDLDLTARLDVAHGRLRNTFVALPDTPLRKVVLTLAGGRKGTLVNSGGLCSRPQRVRAGFLAHSGKHHGAHPVVATECRP